MKEVCKKEQTSQYDKTISKVSNSKEEVETLKLRKHKTITMSLDKLVIHPLITYTMVEKAIKFTTKNIEDKGK